MNRDGNGNEPPTDAKTVEPSSTHPLLCNFVPTVASGSHCGARTVEYVMSVTSPVPTNVSPVVNKKGCFDVTPPDPDLTRLRQLLDSMTSSLQTFTQPPSASQKDVTMARDTSFTLTNPLSNGNNSNGNNAPTQDQEIRQRVLANLAALGALTVGDDNLIFEGSRFVLPETMAGNINGAVQYLQNYERQQETKFQFNRTFLYRPYDGAAAFDRAMRRVFGTAGLGKSTYDMFGQEHKPELQTVNIGVNATIQVPWGHVAFPPLAATFQLGGARHAEFGIVFNLGVEAPRKFRGHVEAFFQVLEEELKTGSIYRGKAINGASDPGFVDLSGVDPAKVIYSNEVMVQLETNMWSLLRYTDRMRENKIPLKRAVLVEGPYGTGKTLAGMLTAQEAVAAGWTFILARPGDNLQGVLQTAQLYSPAVVWYEDIDVLAQGHSDMQISKLLDSLDGITNKGTEILAGFTTNHVNKIQKGVLRPGRLDAVIHVGGLDRDGFEKLTKVVVPAGRLDTSVDFDIVAKAFDGLLPAFAKEAIDRAMRYSITRNQGALGTITTEDLVHAAEGLRPQLQLMREAQEGVQRPTLDVAVQDAVVRAATGLRFMDTAGDSSYALMPADYVQDDYVGESVNRALSQHGEN